MASALSDVLMGYLVVGLVVIGLPMVFFIIVFAPGLMRTTGEHIGESGFITPDSNLAIKQENTENGQRLDPQVALSSSLLSPRRRRTFENTP